MRPVTYTAAVFTALNPILRASQQGVESDTGRSKTGDGTTPWRSLEYSAGPNAGAARRLHVCMGNPTGFTDLFNRADSALTLGSPWTSLRGTWGVSSNAAYPAAGVGNPALMDIVVADSGLADGRITATMAAAAVAGNNHGIVFRCVDVSNYVALVQTTAFGGWILRSVVAGATVDSTFIFASYAAGTVVSAVFTGSTIRVYFNGVLTATVTVNKFMYATQCGFIAPDGSNISRWDSFAVGTDLTYEAGDYAIDQLGARLWGPYTGSAWPASPPTLNQLPRYTTAGRPTAAAAGPGANYYDVTLSKPVWSDGTAWRDSAGTAV